MRVEILQHWGQRLVSIRKSKASLSSHVERIEVMSVRLDELRKDFEQIHYKLESLETERQERLAESMKGSSLPHEEVEAHLDSAYWIG